MVFADTEAHSVAARKVPGNRIVRIALVASVVLTLFASVVDKVNAQNAPPPVEIQINDRGYPIKAYFAETQHHLSGEFLHHWLDNGDFTIYGFPISEPVVEDGRIVQYFERARLELWPENAGTEWVIQGTLLGNWKAESQQLEDPFQPFATDPRSAEDDYYFFPETGHTLANAFKKYWHDNGAVHVFGFPISEEFEEEGQIIQYFERARMEWAPENAGTAYEVLLGHLGKEWAEAHDVDLSGIEQADNSAAYDAGIFDRNWASALVTDGGVRWAFVDVDALNVRAVPDADAEVLDTVYYRRPLQTNAMVRGTAVKGNNTWFRLATGGYVPAIYVDPLIVPQAPRTYAGNWVDVNLSYFYAIGYSWDTPVYVAIITAGREERTPKGVFEVQSRVRNEIMDSATVGIPKGSPEYYYLENVEFTQYFLTGGYALHGNYWTQEWAFGRFSSNGCVGLMWDDAAFYWNHLYIGSVVDIHF